jgi:hypothetical protein
MGDPSTSRRITSEAHFQNKPNASKSARKRTQVKVFTAHVLQRLILHLHFLKRVHKLEAVVLQGRHLQQQCASNSLVQLKDTLQVILRLEQVESIFECFPAAWSRGERRETMGQGTF